jgi:pyruvate dehydrogenase E2 component (dihydrolipoamide acetyltransferase)
LKHLRKNITVQVDDAEVEDASGTPEDLLRYAVLGGLGTFTVMNLGMYGIKSCAPIIREPQACASAVGAMENQIVPNDDPNSEEIYKESVVMTATLSCDHRVVDGAVEAQWLAAFKSHVENPSTLLL